MKKHLAHLAAALAVTLLFGAAAGPLSAAAAAPTAILDEENTAAAESRLNQSWLDMEIEYDDLNPVYQLYLSSAAPDDWVYQWYSTNPAVATVDRNGLVTAQKPGKTTIVANTYTTTLRCDVTVVSNVGRVTLNQERLYLENIGGTAALRASVAVENGDAVPNHLDYQQPCRRHRRPLWPRDGGGRRRDGHHSHHPGRPQRLLQCLLWHAGGDSGTDRGR